MASIAKSTVNCTNSIIISDIKIHMDEDGRYSLNDLHTASGKEDKHQPAFFMRRNETIELINEIFNSANMQDKKPVDSKKGRYGGTYACKELVYSYAMWISAAFALKVIRAYDSMVSGELQKMEAKRYGAKTTVDERTPLRDAVDMLVSKKRLMYPEAYAMIHQRFNVDSIEDLDSRQIHEAIEYVHRVVLEGELMPDDKLPASITRQFTDEELCSLAWLWRAGAVMITACRGIYPLLKVAEHREAGHFYSIGHEYQRTLNKAREVIKRETAHIEFQPWRDDNWSRVLPHLRNDSFPTTD
ncbi:KilA-N domain-containing protein [Salmonella enterica subsp. enterica serovar Newport]|nr:phage antirepressor Ant [Salmonella enterica subsp. enterica serovar Newport]ECH7648924.1 phage antirepressor Ant [Salmonella enterica subsp. enterica serovar Newport]ECO1529699.1 phage antirepressor Ant [Salmonella enterica subsp. enterica serovar Newport]EHG5342777.1 phage antirepressor Ant [Salmonella enterica subsp. enterica serovar Newport]EHG5751263.1 phage antirepressor Ant [Salmonella enterica subsp. enterica serovar Newport]